MMKTFSNILQYKELLFNLTIKELKLKYKNSILGFLWSFLNPLMMLVVYTFAFKFVMKIQIENFTVFLLAGLLPWIFFQSSVQVGTNSIVGNANLIKKVYFPREIVPLSIVLSNFINFSITLIVLFIAVFIFKVKVGLGLLVLPLVLILMILLTVGISLTLSAINVIYRDVAHLVEIAFMAWFYLTPIVYSIDLIPERFRVILLLNPMTLVIESVRATIVYNQLPKLLYLAGIGIYVLFFLVLGNRVFKNIEKRFAEEI